MMLGSLGEVRQPRAASDYATRQEAKEIQNVVAQSN